MRNLASITKRSSRGQTKYVRGQVQVRLIITDLGWDTFTSIRVGLLQKEGIPVFERVAHESTNCAEVGVTDFVAKDELGTVSDMVKCNMARTEDGVWCGAQGSRSSWGWRSISALVGHRILKRT